jgi:hypothetical protein
VGLPCEAIRRIASLRLRRTGKPWLRLLRVFFHQHASSARLAATHPAGSRLAGDSLTDPEEPVIVRDVKQLRILLVVVAGFLLGFGLLLFLIATDV